MPASPPFSRISRSRQGLRCKLSDYFSNYTRTTAKATVLTFRQLGTDLSGLACRLKQIAREPA